MKIVSSSYQSTLLSNIKKEKEAELNFSDPAKPKQDIREAVQRRIAEMNEARTSNGEDDPKVQLLLEKFKSGKKLSIEEISYIRKHAPGMVEKIERIMHERKMIELGMKSAPTKSDVLLVVFQASQQIEMHSNAEDLTIRANHLTNALHEYEQTEEYKKKPRDIVDKHEKEQRQAQRNNINYSTKFMLQTYSQNNTTK